MSVNEEALTLNPIEKIQLIDELLLSLDVPSKEIDEIWSKEVEDRIKAYDDGLIKSVTSTDVFAKYN
ncbi:MAG: addiction module protein [Arcobacteraceae bacterium]